MMKILTTSALLFVMCSGALMSQSIYFRAGTGYGLPLAGVNIGSIDSETAVATASGTTYSSSTKAVNASYGAGSDFNFAFGYKLNENFIIDLNFQYLLGRKYKTGSKYDYTGSYVENDYDYTTTSSKGLFINPSVIFSAGFGKAAPYGRIGFIAASPTVTGEKSYYYNGDGTSTRDSKWEYTKGTAFGFQSAVGMNWKLSEKLDLFTELNFIGMTYYAGNYKLIKSLSDTYDNLPNMSVSQKETVYKKSFDPSKVNIDSTKPTIALRESTPFSSLSFQAGIRFDIWKMKSE